MDYSQVVEVILHESQSIGNPYKQLNGCLFFYALCSWLVRWHDSVGRNGPEPHIKPLSGSRSIPRTDLLPTRDQRERAPSTKPARERAEMCLKLKLEYRNDSI